MRKLIKYFLIAFMFFIGITSIKAIKINQDMYENFKIKRAYIVGKYIFDLSKHNPTLKDLMLAAQSLSTGEASIIEIKIAENLDGELTKEYRELLESKKLTQFPEINATYIYMSEIKPDNPELEDKIELNETIQEVTYTATFNANGGSGTLKSVSCTIPAVYNGATQATSCEVSLPNNEFTYNGWTFVGWSIFPDAISGAIPGVKTYLTSDTTYYAIWKRNVEDISLIVEKNTLTVGDKIVIGVNVIPTNAVANLTWQSNNPDIASVSEDGIVNANSEGIVTVTATNENGKKDTVTLTIENANLISTGFLKTSGTRIVDGNGQEMALKGFNLGGWFSRSFSMTYFKSLANSEEEFLKTGLSCINNEAFYQALSTRTNNQLSNSQVQNISKKYYESFMTEEDFDLIAQTGANLLRLPIEYTYFNLLDGNMEQDFQYIDWAINQAKKRGMYVVLDLHLVEGRQNSGGWCEAPTFFKNETYMTNAITLWQHIAYRYRNEIAVAGYDILNEPETGKDNLIAFYDRAYKAIRKYDNNHIIFMEETCIKCGHNGASEIQKNSIGQLPRPSEYGWTNVVYSVHDYVNLDINDDTGDYTVLPNVLISRLNSRLSILEAKMKDYNIPYYVGEFSYLGSTAQRANENARYREYLCVWQCAMEKYDQLGLSYTPWTYKANNETYFGLIYYGSKNDKIDLLNDSYEELMKKVSYKSSENMRFNEDFYLMFLNQYGGRIAEKINLSSSSITLNVNQSTIVNYTITPSTTIDKAVTWVSSNENVAKVDPKTGKITAISPGTAKITASNKPFVLNDPIDSNDIYYCSDALKNSICNCSANNKNTSLDINVSASLTVIVK